MTERDGVALISESEAQDSTLNRSSKVPCSTETVKVDTDMPKCHRVLAFVVPLIVVSPAFTCEPVVHVLQVMVPALALSGSIVVLVLAVVVKSALFAIFERRLPPLRAAWRMFLGNVLTSLVGVLVAALIASGAGTWLIGIPLVCLLGWLPSRRLVKVAPLAWLARISPIGLGAIMTGALLTSCVLFIGGQENIRTHQLLAYWITKLAAIFLALLASVTLTTVWEEWVIWRLSSRPEGAGFFRPVLRANLYVRVLVMAIPAVLILPKRPKSPDFLAKRPNPAITRTIAPSE